MTDNLFQKTINVMFAVCVGLLLYPILVNKWVVTGDGPCHLYNAKILSDLFLGRHSDFYLEYYKLDIGLNPNLWDHVILACLQVMFSASISEKIFFALYTLTFAFGARYLCNSIQTKSTWAAIPVLLFAFHHLLFKGFYNFSWSIAGAFWVIGYFISNSEHLSDWKVGVKLSFLLLLNYFMHPIGFAYGVGGIGFILITHLLSKIIKSNPKELLIEYVTKMSTLGLILLPSVLLYINFASKNSFSKKLDWNSLANLNSLVTYVNGEIVYSLAISKIAILFLIVGVIYRLLRGPAIQKGDGILLLGLFFIFLFHANLIDDGMMGGDRLKFLPHLSIFIWLATMKFTNWVKLSISMFGLVMLTLLSIERFPAYSRAADWVDDYLECEPKIKSNTKLLTINYELNGTISDGSEMISTENWAFMHGTSYLGAMKPLILSDNYQAHMTWFPLNWKEDRFSFYNSTGVDGINFESRPPRADIIGYAEKSGKGPIDYILIIGQAPDLMNHEYGQEIERQLGSNYNLICTSVSKKSKLYELK